MVQYFNAYQNSQNTSAKLNLQPPLTLTKTYIPSQCNLTIIQNQIYYVLGKKGLYKTDSDTLVGECLIPGDFELNILIASEQTIAVTDKSQNLFTFDLATKTITNRGKTQFGSGSINRKIKEGFLLYEMDEEGYDDSITKVNSSFKTDWTFYFEEGTKNVALSEDESKLVISGLSGGLLCLNAQDGQPLWYKKHNQIGLGVATSISIYRDLIICGASDRHIMAIDLSNGDLLWSHQMQGSSNYPCVSQEGIVYKVSDNFLTLIDTTTGAVMCETKLQSPLKHELYRSLESMFCLPTESHLWAITDNGLLYAINLKNQEIDWHQPLDGAYSMGHPFLIHNKKLYIYTLIQPHTFILHGK